MTGHAGSGTPEGPVAPSFPSRHPWPAVDLGTTPSHDDALALVPESYAAANDLVPLRLEGETLVVACADPGDDAMLSELQVLTRRRVRALGAPRVEIQEAIQERYEVLEHVDEHVRAFTQRLGRSTGADARSVLQAIDEQSPVVNVVNLIITQGLRDRASDIHLEPQRTHLRVRFRIDGILTDRLRLPQSIAPSLSSRLKVMADLDIVDRHRAQDGQFRFESGGHQVDVRVSTMETQWGEKVVLRLLDQSRTLLRLDQLGLGGDAYHRLSGLLRSPFGLIVVSGPTGSGKTTTLYAAINELDPIGQNITTIEDPVEYTFENINQIPIRRVANLTFANGLKAILRQDPDVIMIGEVRDRETAEIAVQSALTGHLVLCSLHATDAASVIQRFIEMGIEGFLVSSALIGVVAQRLVRRICTYCRQPDELGADERQLWFEHGDPEKAVFYRGRGCVHCAQTGYRGRIGVFEVLPVSESIKRLISLRAPAQEIRSQALREGMRTLREDGVRKVADDLTTLSEVIRCVWSS
ncbi:MAG TPA: GspE/PulE family protein [Candidatus Dormibacteraeota bacterium]|nr:GspE/PulE family protein [Candidatus Dormibacteraeota bacterium]